MKPVKAAQKEANAKLQALATRLYVLDREREVLARELERLSAQLGLLDRLTKAEGELSEAQKGEEGNGPVPNND